MIRLNMQASAVYRRGCGALYHWGQRRGVPSALSSRSDSPPELHASMSPRPYRLGQRQAAAEQTRARILAAARELLVASAGFSGFSVEAVARQAGVARMTVYYQFGSKPGLLEALYD